MRDVGGRVLRRRAPVTQTATAQQQEQQPQASQTTARAPLAEGAAPEHQPALTQAGRPRQRMKWTVSINESILRFYYKVTNLGQETIGYRQQLYAEFCREYPDIQVSEQRVSDQYRVIVRNNLIPETRRNTIKSEVEREINNQELVLDQVPNEILDEQIPEIPIPETQPDNTQQENNELRDSLENEMARAVQEFNGTNPLSRPPLPRINSCKKLGALLQIVNTEVLPNYVAEAHTLEYLHMLIYCAATAIANVMGVKIRTRRGTNNERTGNRIAPWEKRLLGKIELLRRDIGQVTEYIRGVRSTRVIRRAEEIMPSTARHSRYDPENNTAHQCLDTLKQKLSVYSGRLRRYKLVTTAKATMLFLRVLRRRSIENSIPL
ncbi:uncharacterized protein LOC126881795 [Diabrotica virgifera virgifera]|uniref:Uncharacterized protein n=1 Tax=Diabrotica virgifera virgifera TaxID=50390 RepID=A0ABM5JWL0_DIAVI|nr:uncharacterized protein LOC126881795 [Diabrotica virgifera virgifera]